MSASISTITAFGSELFLRLAHLRRFQPTFYGALHEAQLGELYIWLERNFPRTHDPDSEVGHAHFVGPRESAGDLRDAVLRHIISLGTVAGVQTLRRTIALLPELAWLPLQLSEAENIMRTKTWVPLKPKEILRVTTSRHGRLVQSPDDLCEVLVEALRNYEDELHGEQTPVRSLWDMQADGTLRPVEEDALSDHIKLFLKRALTDSGIVLNREVEIGRVAGAPIGSRTDIRVDAVRLAENGDDAYDAITAVIETKGCWNQQLLPAIKNQLYDDYLTRLGAPLGIYLVGWFDKTKWDSKDPRRRRVPSWNQDEAQERLDREAAALPPGFIVRVIVLDCHAH